MIKMDVFFRTAQDAAPSVAPPHFDLDGGRYDSRVAQDWLCRSRDGQWPKKKAKDLPCAIRFRDRIDEFKPAAI
jgi:hypothetical protein